MSAQHTHTPGPWAASLVRVQRQIYDQHGGPIAYTHGQNVDADVHESNARLIAAAPEMLVILQTIVRLQELGADGALILDDNSPTMDAIRDVLAKVGGAS